MNNEIRIKNPKVKTMGDYIKSLGYRIKDILNPEPFPYLPGLEDVVMCIIDFLKKFPGVPVNIIGDYDFDGMGSQIIMKMTLNALGIDPYQIIPDRVKDGYGFSEKFLPRLRQAGGHGLLITADNGITAVEQVEKAKEMGFTVVIIDHHEALESGQLPAADAILNPHTVKGEHYKEYCAAGLCYRVCRELLERMGKLTEGLDGKLVSFAGISTVTDVVPMIGDNRNLVKRALAVMEDRKSTVALNALLDIKELRTPDEEDIGFTIGPIFNAVGRMPDGDPMDLVNTLCVDDTGKIRLVNQKLNGYISLNEERKELVRDAEKNLQTAPGEFPVVSYVPGMPLGIVGLLAGKLTESHKTAAFVFADDSDPEICKGSARAGESGLNIKSMLDHLKPLLLSYGGHAAAAGLSLKRADLNAFKKAAHDFMVQHGCGIAEQAVVADIVTNAEKLQHSIREQQKYAPYGAGFPKPVWLVEGFKLVPNGRDNLPYGVSQKSEEYIRFYGIFADAVSFRGIKLRWIESGCPLKMSLYGTIGAKTGKSAFGEIKLMDFVEETDEPEITEVPDETGTGETEIKTAFIGQPRAELAAVTDERRSIVKKTLFSDLKVGAKGIVPCRIMKLEEDSTGQGSAYCRLELSDSSKTCVTANLWETTKEILTRNGITVGGIYNVSVLVKEYRGNASYVITGSDPLADIMATINENPEEYTPSGPYPAQDMISMILQYVNAFCSENLKKIVQALYDQYKDKLLYWGAAKSMHHNYMGGWAWHTASMVQEAFGIMQSRRFNGSINKGLVIAACALHDIGKIEEMKTDEIGVSEYTEAGNLFGHLLIGYTMIRDKARDFGILEDEEVKHLLHIIVSHHGNEEWGAIKVPVTREAMLVFMIDNIDAKDEAFCCEYQALQPGEMTANYAKGLGRPVVRPAYAEVVYPEA